MSIDLRGFTYYPDNWGYLERWESKFSEYNVTQSNGLYRIGKNVDEFWSFGDEPTVYMNLEPALNTLRRKAIINFFDE